MPASASWTIRKLFSLRPLVHPWITNVVGNGKSTFLWLDNWHPLGPLFARGRNAVTRDIRRATPATFVPHPSQEDTVIWNLTSDKKFSVQSAWNAIRRQHSKVSWFKIIWFKHHVPCWAIIQWLANLGRLATKDRLLKWGMAMHDQCVLCSASVETDEHLFFHCTFSSQLWKSLQKDLTFQCPFNGLPQIMDWMFQVNNGPQFSCSLSKVALAALIYHVWGARNGRIFKSFCLSVQQLEINVRTDIRACVSSWRGVKEVTP
ncbi:hypothetical protein RHMOL_Rhmol01G0284300 [Rhododendron molle]|uniref:Uncharacterized protein n=1 Tax=Rhododendron molle TaxID=49168 RepID=A0ACC0Q6Y3_RHOML|nr:hypothetical protein RHMOL_Rhmol01G0284300 [Rhododendron molle]